MDVGTRIECKWCRSQNLAAATSCSTCGAPLEVRNLVSDSGWREAPRLRDMFEHPAGTWQSWRSWGDRYLWLRLSGPGRVAVHFAWDRLEDPGRKLAGSSPATRRNWSFGGLGGC